MIIKYQHRFVSIKSDCCCVYSLTATPKEFLTKQLKSVRWQFMSLVNSNKIILTAVPTVYAPVDKELPHCRQLRVGVKWRYTLCWDDNNVVFALEFEQVNVQNNSELSVIIDEKRSIRKMHSRMNKQTIWVNIFKVDIKQMHARRALDNVNHEWTCSKGVLFAATLNQLRTLVCSAEVVVRHPMQSALYIQVVLIIWLLSLQQIRAKRRRPQADDWRSAIYGACHL